MNQLKQIDLSKRSFPANGKTYFIETGDLSIERWAKYEEFVLEMQYGVSQVEMFHKFKEITELANKLQFADIAVLAHNIQNGMLSVIERLPVSLKICALFMNSENEDRGAINDDLIAQKIGDWQAEGYGVSPFFQSALAFSRLIGETSNMLTPESLEALLQQIKSLKDEPIKTESKEEEA